MECITKLISAISNIPSVLTELAVSFLLSYIIVIPVWNLYSIRKLSFKIKQRKTWLKILFVGIPTFFIVNAIWQTGITGKFLFGLEFQNLPNYLVFFATVLTAYLLYRTFNIQRKAYQIERFEHKFYELLKIHKQNVSEMQINLEGNKKINGRATFKAMFEELRYGYYICKNEYDKLIKDKTINENYDLDKLLQLIYIYFYWGTPLITLNKTFYRSVSKFNKTLNANLFNKIDAIHNNRFHEKVTDGVGEVFFKEKYMPFNGHSEIFGHYYRHLFQTVKFVDKQPNSLISQLKKAEYLTTIRAQLSDYEQLLLYYNAISEFGSKWIEERYFTKYRMIHNIPLATTEGIGNDIEERFIGQRTIGNKELFEWHE